MHSFTLKATYTWMHAEGELAGARLRDVRNGLTVPPTLSMATVIDVKKATMCGADAVILSNHGGRQLDRAPVPLMLVQQVSTELIKRSSIIPNKCQIL